MIPAHHVPTPKTEDEPCASGSSSTPGGDAGQSSTSPNGEVSSRLQDLTLDNARFIAGSQSSSVPDGAPTRDRKGKSPVRRGLGVDSVMEDPARVQGEMKDEKGDTLFYRAFKSEEEDLEGMTRLIEAELSEPYNIYTFRYFLMEWPHLTLLVFPSPDDPTPIAVIVCKQDVHRGKTNRGYIAMLSVDKAWRRRGIASSLVQRVIELMQVGGVQEVVLETEVDNESSLALYDHLGFVREKRLFRFYTNGKDAFRLILPMENHPLNEESDEEAEAGRFEISSGPDDWDQFALTWNVLKGTREGELLRMIAEEEGSQDPESGEGVKPPLPPRQAGWDDLYT